MKKDNSARVIAILLCTIMVLLILLIVSFLLYICKEEFGNEKNIEIVDLSGQVEAISIENEFDEDKEPEEVITVAIKPSTQIQQVDNNIYSSSNDKFYYSQLEEYSKLIYKSLEEQKDTLKTGRGSIKLPSKLGKLLETEEGKESIQGIFTIAMNAFEYDNPDIFYLDISKLVLYYEGDTSGNYNFYLKNENGNYYIDDVTTEEEAIQKMEEVNSVVQKIKDEIANKGINTEYKKILYVHDWIVNNIKYDETLNKTNRNNIYGAFVEKEVTCGGYAKAFKYLMDELGINCIIIQGKATSDDTTEYHAWNYVGLNGKWYGIDCTWDDPIIQGDTSRVNSKVHYTYFLKGKNTLEESHFQFHNFYSTNVDLNYPELNLEDY